MLQAYVCGFKPLIGTCLIPSPRANAPVAHSTGRQIFPRATNFHCPAHLHTNRRGSRDRTPCSLCVRRSLRGRSWFKGASSCRDTEARSPTLNRNAYLHPIAHASLFGDRRPSNLFIATSSERNSSRRALISYSSRAPRVFTHLRDGGDRRSGRVRVGASRETSVET